MGLLETLFRIGANPTDGRGRGESDRWRPGVISGPGSMPRIDPLRWAVQAALALYLLPVLLLVLLVGGCAMMAGDVARVLRRVVLALGGPALARSGAVRERARAVSAPHHLRKGEYR